MRHFLASLLPVDGIEADVDRVRLGDRSMKLGVFPMGIDAVRFATLSQDPVVSPAERRARMRWNRPSTLH